MNCTNGTPARGTEPVYYDSLRKSHNEANGQNWQLAMSFGVFLHRSDSIYDDLPTERYQFPKPYLSRAQQCVGDWVIYYEPTKVPDTRGYFAVAKVQQITPDPTAQDRFLALIEPGSYLPFVSPVPFADASGLAEQGLLNEKGRISGRAQAAIRAISPADFNRIIERGLPDNDTTLPRVDAPSPLSEMSESLEPFDHAILPRDRIAFMSSRINRDRVFRQIVLSAYDARCAVTGLKLINGGGRAEVEAAHIRPVEHDGPDIVQNGLALSGTAHWMFDRGLISVADDHKILISAASTTRRAFDPWLIQPEIFFCQKRRASTRADNTCNGIGRIASRPSSQSENRNGADYNARATPKLTQPSAPPPRT